LHTSRGYSWLERTSTATLQYCAALADQPMTQVDAWRMVRKRALAAGIMAPIGNHSFRATGIMAYLANGGTLEHAQSMARTKARAPPSSMTAPRSGSRRMRSSGS
jgi:site-specific recombinase XerD